MNACQILYYSSDSRFNISMAQGRLPYGGGMARNAPLQILGGKKFANVFGGKKCVSRRGETQVSMYVYGHLGVKYMYSPCRTYLLPPCLSPQRALLPYT